MRIPTVETEHLIIREFTLEDSEARRLLIEEAFQQPIDPQDNARWMQWIVLNFESLASMHQPPYGDRAIALKSTGELIGSVGLVPAVIPWAILPEFRAPGDAPHHFTSPEFGLFWAVHTAHRGLGYAAEAAQIVIDFVFNDLWGKRIVATTEHNNLASQRVMLKLGMRVYHNPGSDPFWFETVGVLDNPRLKG